MFFARSKVLFLSLFWRENFTAHLSSHLSFVSVFSTLNLVYCTSFDIGLNCIDHYKRVSFVNYFLAFLILSGCSWLEYGWMDSDYSLNGGGPLQSHDSRFVIVSY